MVRAGWLILVACGGSGGEMPPPIDAPPPPRVLALPSCPATVAASIVDSDTRFIPSAVTIAAGETIKITTTAEHYVIPNTATTTDPVLMVGRNQTACFRFNAAGSYGIACGVHGFAATITAQ